MLLETQATSLSAFVELVWRISTEWGDSEGPGSPWFRGQADARWPLLPRAFRYRNISEPDLRSEFKRRASPLLTEGRPSDDWEWYFLMQHYGVPTRLLDWSEGSLLALYFAIRPFPSPDPTMTAAAVWAVDPHWLNGITIGKKWLLDTYDIDAAKYLGDVDVDLIPPELPAAIRPPHVSRRIAAQRSTFTIHGSDRDWVHKVSVQPAERLAKITIPAEAIPQIAPALERCGISETSVFPDIEALSRELTESFAKDAIIPRTPV